MAVDEAVLDAVLGVFLYKVGSSQGSNPFPTLVICSVGQR